MYLESRSLYLCLLTISATIITSMDPVVIIENAIIPTLWSVVQLMVLLLMEYSLVLVFLTNYNCFGL